MLSATMYAGSNLSPFARASNFCSQPRDFGEPVGRTNVKRYARFAISFETSSLTLEVDRMSILKIRATKTLARNVEPRLWTALCLFCSCVRVLDFKDISHMVAIDNGHICYISAFRISPLNPRCVPLLILDFGDSCTRNSPASMRKYHVLATAVVHALPVYVYWFSLLQE